MDELQFRSATFGGFNRQDVLAYVEHLTVDHKSKLEALEQELSEMKETLVQAQEQGAAQGGQIAELESAVQGLEMKAQELELVTAEKLALQERLDEAEPLAASYTSIKEKAATIELDAHQRSAAIVGQAEEEAIAMRLQAKSDVECKRSEAEDYARNAISEADAYAERRMKTADELASRRTAEMEAALTHQFEDAQRRLTAMRSAYDKARAALGQSLCGSQQVVAAVQESLTGIGEEFSAMDALLLEAECADAGCGAEQ